MILIYLNYKLWLVKWKVIYTKILDTVVLDRNEFNRARRFNGSHAMNIDITGALYTLRTQYRFTRTHRKEGASGDNVY